MADLVKTPYSGIAPLFTAAPGWVPAIEQQRYQSYGVYDDIYWNESSTFRLMMRGGDAEEDIIYIPNPRIIVETINRYVGNGFGFSVDEASGTPASRTLAQTTFAALFARERFVSKYNSNKRFGLVRGDWVWHVLADPKKPAGSRLSILPVHPGNYFPVFESDLVPGGDPEKIVKVHLAEEVMDGDDTVVRRQTYTKVVNPDGTVTIWSELSFFKPDEWFDATKKAERILVPMFALPAEITSIPVYHVRNFDEPNNPYGSSELRGFARLMAAINQGFTDEDITLALEGLGVYATDSPSRPVNAETREPEDWSVYPGRVVHNAANFRRIQGVGSVVPYGDHIERMTNALKEATGTNDAARGNVDVTVAESGVALLLRLAPILALAGEKDQIILDVHAQMFYDLRAWLKAYEETNLDDVTIVPTLGDKLPKNHAGIVDMIVAMRSANPPVISAQSAREWLAREGLKVFAVDEAARVALEQAEAAKLADPFGGRVADELGAEEDGASADVAAVEGGVG